MKNLTGTNINWDSIEVVEAKKQPKQVKIEEVYTGPEFKFGDIVRVKGKEDFGTGVIFKTGKNHSFWVAFPDKADDHLTSMPCLLNAYKRTELQLEEVQKN